MGRLPNPLPFMAWESFGCKSLLIPGSELLPRDPVIDSWILPGWQEVSIKDLRKSGPSRDSSPRGRRLCTERTRTEILPALP